MAKKVNPFAGDFQNIKQSADEKVIAFLKQDETRKAKNSLTPVKEEYVTAKATTQDKKKVNLTRKGKGQPKVKSSVKYRSVNLEEWGKPVALLNTRIPQKMSELLDDLVYQRKKEGLPCTKQAIAIEALDFYLRQHGLHHS